MNYGFGPINSVTAFLADDFYLPEEEEQLREAITTREDLTAKCVNLREIAQYELTEVITGQQWFANRRSDGFNSPITQNRTGYRRTFDLVILNQGPIPAGSTTIRIQPTINFLITPLKLYGAATIAGPMYVFFPSGQISIVFDNSVPTSQTITIDNTTGSALSQCYVTIEYLKQN